MTISFNPEWFKSAYYVYVLKIVHETKGHFFYIGQTGDRNHISARSPFYRLMGHYNTYNFSKGTDAQLVKGLFVNDLIKHTEGNSKRVCVEEAIVNKVIILTANYFKIQNFGDVDHKLTTKTVEHIELKLIGLFRAKGYNLFNDENKIGDKKKLMADAEIDEKADTIFKLLKL